MRETGIVRAVDELGRLVLPIEIRRNLGLGEGESVEFFVDDENGRIMFRKYRAKECVFCQDIEPLHYFRGRLVCETCLRSLRESGLSDKSDAERPPSPEPDGDPKARTSARRSFGRRKDTMQHLAEAMRQHPDGSQKDWAVMIGVSPSRVSQLMKALKPDGRT